MNKEFINAINKILINLDIDPRIKPLIKLYFLGKLQLNQVTLNELEEQMNTLCAKIANVEFTESVIVSAYSSKANVLTVNKRLFAEGKADEAILPVFMKFETAMNLDNRRQYANNIEDFISATKIAKACNVPISDRLYKLYEMAESLYGHIADRIDVNIQDKKWLEVCNAFNTGLNKAIITGSNRIKELLEGARLFYHEVFDKIALEDPDFNSKFKTEEYQERAARIIAGIKYINSPTALEARNTCIDRLKLLTGCTEQMIEKVVTSSYIGNTKIGDIVCDTIKNTQPKKLTEELIATKVQTVIDKKPNWDSRVKQLVIPFFIRSQKIYSWTFDEFQERLNQVDLTIDNIKFEKLNRDTMGYIKGDTIYLGLKSFYDNHGRQKWSLAGTLFHELGHATDEHFRENIMTKGCEQWRTASTREGHGSNFYEWTNTIFERSSAANRFYVRDGAMVLIQAPYNDLRYLGSMVSCALGISEVEYAILKDKGRKYEKIWLQEIFHKSNDEHALHNIQRVKEIFDEYYYLRTYSLLKRTPNQGLLNEAYSRCVQIMQERIENDIQSGKESEEYKKRQMFFLKKMNYNYELASKSSGVPLMREHVIHDIGFCTDDISKQDLDTISSEFIAMAEFDFSNSPLNKYDMAMAPKKKKSFIESLRERFSNKVAVQDKKTLEKVDQEHDDPDI